MAALPRVAGLPNMPWSIFLYFNPVTLRFAKTLWSFGLSELVVEQLIDYNR